MVIAIISIVAAVLLALYVSKSQLYNEMDTKQKERLSLFPQVGAGATGDKKECRNLINMEEEKFLFKFVKPTMLGALTWHSAPFTGSVKINIPKGTRAWLSTRMSPANHYIRLVDGQDSEQIVKTAQARAREESPIPDRFNGGLSFFISIPLLLSDRIEFISAEPVEGIVPGEPKEVLSILREEFLQARQCAIHEESESFKKMVRYPMMSDEERKMFLTNDIIDIH